MILSVKMIFPKKYPYYLIKKMALVLGDVNGDRH